MDPLGANSFTINPHHLNGVVAPMVAPAAIAGNAAAASFANGLMAAPPGTVMSNGMVLDQKGTRIILIQQADGQLVTAASAAGLAAPGMHYTVASAAGMPQVSMAQSPLVHHTAMSGLTTAADPSLSLASSSKKKKRKGDDTFVGPGGKKGKGGRGQNKGPPPPPATGANVKAALPSTTTLSSASTDSEQRAIRNSYVTEVSQSIVIFKVNFPSFTYLCHS